MLVTRPAPPRDRSFVRMTSCLRALSEHAPLPPRGEDEPFRRYFVRATTAWLEQHAEDAPHLALRAGRLVHREVRRHPATFAS